MAELQTKYLLLNGSIVLLTGLLSGIPMGLAIVRKKGENTIRTWRVAHSTLIMDGLMLIIVGVVVPGLPIDELTLRVLVWALIPSAYGFVLALIIGAWVGYRGLTPKPYGINTVLFGGHTIGALGSLIGVAILTWGFFKAF
jgi:hypothetical protein